MIKLTLEEFLAKLREQGSFSRENLVFKCPICGTLQTMGDLIRAGAGKDEAEVEKYIAFSCIGRFTNAGPHRKDAPPGKGCDWTLGGLLCIRDLDVITEDGQAHPRFMPATPEEALAHWQATGQPWKEKEETPA